MTAALRAQDLCVTLGATRVLHGVTLELGLGWTAVVGPNGAGKSTLLRALAGLLPCDSGGVVLQGRPLLAWTTRERARHIAWLAQQGYESIGILGTSLGSCLSMLAAAHEPLIKAAALNHISPYFADVVWEGLSTAHVRNGLEGHIELDQLRRIWLPISPLPYLEKVRDKRIATLGPDHPFTLWTLNNLGSAYRATGRLPVWSTTRLASGA